LFHALLLFEKPFYKSCFVVLIESAFFVEEQSAFFFRAREKHNFVAIKRGGGFGCVLHQRDGVTFAAKICVRDDVLDYRVRTKIAR
jgi:hypothetical protein